jgi:RNA polymerase primary sigma factor
VSKRTGGRRRSARAAQLPRAVDEGRESLDFYLQEISRIPLLKIEEETALARRAFKGDVEAQEKLARHNVRFVVSVAKKFQNRGVPLMDLIGEGNLGLMTAARKFDPDRGVKFISYAVWWIRQAIQAAIARHGRPVRVPLNRTADLNRLGRTTVLLTERLGRAPTTEELVEATGLTRDAVRALGALHIEALRLDHPVREADDRGRMERPPDSRGDRCDHDGQQPDDGSGDRAGRAPAPGREGPPALLRVGRREEPDSGGDRSDDGRHP